MRAASLVIAALISSPSLAGFCLDVAPFLGPAAVGASTRVGMDAVCKPINPFADAELLSADAKILKQREGDEGFNLPLQFEQLFKTPVRELGQGGPEESRMFEGMGLQLLFFGLLASLWLYRRGRVRKTPLANMQMVLRKLQNEIRSYDHEPHIISDVLVQLKEFCTQANISPVIQKPERLERSQLAIKLMVQISLRLPRCPMRPSSYAAAAQQFKQLLESLRDGRVLELEYQRCGA